MQSKTLRTYKIQIYGRIQGVGFRPFVYHIASKFSLKGCVFNNEKGVVVKFNSNSYTADLFLTTLKKQKPKVAVITNSSIEKIGFENFTNFSVKASKTTGQTNIPLTPDIAICSHCKNEVADPKNRRFEYAFTTCVHCGPRYAITKQYPFERKNTTLSYFEMCIGCQEEYRNPANRRFHSQTNSCANCGIQLELTDNTGNLIEKNQSKIILKIANYIKNGKIVAIKNTHGYLLCCDAKNPDIIQQLRTKKQRPNKPFAVLYPNLQAVENEFDISETEKQQLASIIAPIVILKNSKKLSIAVDIIAPKSNKTGVMLSSSTLLHLIMNELQQPIIATSGNMHGSSIVTTKKKAEKMLCSIADYFVHHNLEIQFPQDDSVLQCVENQIIILRRSRGLAPSFVDFCNDKKGTVLAMGAHLKSTFSLVPNTNIYTSQYLGNLDSYDVFQRYKTTLHNYLNLFEIQPDTVLVDKHPQYQSSVLGNEIADKYKANLIEIQHHKAHFASVLGEHQLFNCKERVLGVVWDGTGLGDDQMIWGGEFFMYEQQVINRFAHFEYYDWIANDKMAKEPRISLLSLLNDKTYIQSKFLESEWHIYNTMLLKNKLKTSSVGRLFDAVASLLGLIDVNTFEAESGMLLEKYASDYKGSDAIDFLADLEYKNIPTFTLISNIKKAVEKGFSKEKLAYSFIYTLVKIIIRVSKKENVKTVACSGGVFQNAVLVNMLLELTKEEAINLKLNEKLASNDENISFGQFIYHQNCKK